MSSLDAQNSSYPAPPSVHWGIILLVALAVSFTGTAAIDVLSHASVPLQNRYGAVPDLLTNLFIDLWTLRQAWFVRRISPESRALYYLAGSITCQLPTMIPSALMQYSWLTILLLLAAFALQIAALFSMKDSLEHHYNDVERCGLSISGIWLILLNTFYLQYHLRNITLWKQRQA